MPRRNAIVRNKRQAAARTRALHAISSVRKGKSKTLSASARAEGTTVSTIRRLLPKALRQHRPGGRIRVTASDRYSARVEIMGASGPFDVTAHGSRQRELAGRHRAAVMQVLRGIEPESVLEKFRGKKVGGHELLTDFDLLSTQANAGVLEQLDSLYVSPDISA